MKYSFVSHVNMVECSRRECFQLWLIEQESLCRTGCNHTLLPVYILAGMPLSPGICYPQFQASTCILVFTAAFAGLNTQRRRHLQQTGFL